MKYKSFLYNNFWLWFTAWIGLLIVSLCLFIHEVEIGKFLLSFTGTILIALLTAMAAFNNMDINEQKKRARDEYLAYIDLLQLICERYYLLRNLIGFSTNNMNIDCFYRSIFTPYIISVTDFKSADFGKFYFLSKKMIGQYIIEEQVDEKYNAFNTVYYTQLEGNLKSILNAIEKRNKQYEDKIVPVLNQLQYLGKGKHSVELNTFEKHLTYFEFTNYLQFCEEINKHICELLEDYKDISNSLNVGARELFDEGIISENGGFNTLHFSSNEQAIYQPLSGEQLKLLNATGYPTNNFVDQNQVIFEG